jgi:hypothetical protein
MKLDGLELCHQKGNKHHMWKGEFASYSALHYWLQREKGKATKCEKCNVIKKCTWANISGKYERNVDDYISLCYSCHFKYDNVGIKMWNTRRAYI